MRFAILGPLEVHDGDAPVRLGGRRQRALLARLLLDHNRTVSVDRLVDDLWGEDVPDSAVKMIHIYVSQLRKLLPDGPLVTRPPGYAIELEPEAIDVVRFTRLRGQGRAALAGGDLATASVSLREGLALWRGAALAEFSEPFALAESAHLEELHLACLEDRIEADLALGRHADLVGELEALVVSLPLRERLRGQLMLALHRSGRHAEALDAYRRLRETLDRELGLEPSPSLRDIERRILQHDAALDLPAPSGLPAPPARDRRPAASLPATDGAAAETRFVESGDIAIAYQVVGSGPLDLVLVHGWVCGFAAGWEREQIARFYRRLASMGRLILFDKRGTGLSDRVKGVAPLEERMDDVRAVMDAVGSRRAARGLGGRSDGVAVRRHVSGAHGGARGDGDVRAQDTGAGLPDRRAEPGSEHCAVGIADRAAVRPPPRAVDRGRRGGDPLVRVLHRPRRQPGGGDDAAPHERRDRRPPRAADDRRSGARPLPRRRVPARGDALHGRPHPRCAGDCASGRRSPSVGGRPGRRPRRDRGLPRHGARRGRPGARPRHGPVDARRLARPDAAAALRGARTQPAAAVPRGADRRGAGRC